MSKKSNKVRPRLLKGFKDYPPSEQFAREKIIADVREVIELMGFMPLQTASLEFADTLLGSHYSKDSLAELFSFVGPDDVEMALRYEFTLSLARYVAARPDLALPFRRYQYGNVWRVDKPGPGRFREFMQFDLDIVGTSNLLADAEIIAAMVATFERLGVERFVVRYSNRKILNGLIEFAGIDATVAPDVFRVIDKLDKQGRKAVVQELADGRIDRSGDKIPGVNLNSDQIGKIEKFLDVAEARDDSPLERVASLFDGISISQEGISELETIISLLSSLGTDTTKTEIDLTVVRGLGYYTGPVFETTLLDLPDYGSVFSGGRYDNLVDRFLGRSIPAVGSSIGVDRLLVALIELKAIDLKSATSQVLVTVMDADRITDYLAIVRQLRNEGIASEVYSGDSRNLTKQIKYADKAGIPVAVIAGSNEFESGEITVKNLVAGRDRAKKTEGREEWLKAEQIQETIPADSLVDYIKNLLPGK